MIVGVLVAAVILSKNFIARSRLTNAQSLVQSSPVLAINDLQLWIENSLDRSFRSSEMVDGNNISVWNNISPSSRTSVTAVGAGPVYSTSYAINSIPAVRFSNSSSDYLTISDARFLNNTDYTICILEKRESNQSNNYFIGDTVNTTSNQNLILGYLSDGAVIHSQAGTSTAANSNSYSSSIVGYAASGKPKLFCFIQNSASGKSTYINGMIAGTSSNTSQLSGITSLSIGKNYFGEIGEVIIFTKALSVAEVKSVTDSFFANLFVSDANVCTVTTPNVTQSSVNQGSGTLTCSPGYSGSPTYTCASGVFTPTGGSCSGITCTITSVAGLNNKTGLAYASSATAIPNTPTSACATGYSGSPTYTCTATGAATIVSNCTPITCTITGVTGLNNKTGLAYASSATAIPNTPTSACATGYSGSPTYTCTTTGAATIVNNNCTAITCSVSVTGISSPSSVSYTATSTPLSCNAAGYSGSVNYTCTTGTLNVTGSCTAANCTVSGVTGVNNTTVASGSGSLTCNVSGWTGSVNYTCTNGTLNTTTICAPTSCSGGTVVQYNNANYCNIGTYHNSNPTTTTVYSCIEACALKFGGSSSNYACGRGNPDGLIYLSTAGGSNNGCWGNMSDSYRACNLISDSNASTTCVSAYSVQTWSGGQMNYYGATLGCGPSNLSGNICYRKL